MNWRADEVGAVAVPVAEGTEPPGDLGQDAAALAAAGFTGRLGQTLVLPVGGRALVAVGIGAVDDVDAAAVRDLAAAFARAVPHQTRLAVELPDRDIGLSPGDFARAVTEGVLLARWRFRISESDDEPIRPRGGRRR
jgi:leucyl aminopeptidase